MRIEMKAISRRRFLQVAGATMLIAAMPAVGGGHKRRGPKKIRIRPLAAERNLRPGEIAFYRRAKFATAADAIGEVKLRSRQYAKRQLTWLRRNGAIHWILWGKEPDFPEALQNATEYLTAHGLG